MTGRGQIISNKIVITGVSSFIGFSLAKYFSNLNYSVIGIISNSKKNYTGIKADRINELSKYPIDLVNLDIVNNRLLEQFIYNYKPNYWIQHAGWAENYGSFEYDIKKGHQINMSPLNIIYPALAKINCSGIIVTGSSTQIIILSVDNIFVNNAAHNRHIIFFVNNNLVTIEFWFGSRGMV